MRLFWNQQREKMSALNKSNEKAQRQTEKTTA